MTNKGIHQALKGEMRLRRIAEKISKSKSEEGFSYAVASLNSGKVKCSEIGLLRISEGIHYSLKGSLRVTRKRQLFFRLFLIAIRCFMGNILSKKKYSDAIGKECYLVYPYLSNPKFLINFTEKTLSSNLPFIFSTNGFLNRIHLWVFVVIDRYSSSKAARDKAILSTGAGLAVIKNTNIKMKGREKVDLTTDYYSNLIILSKEKNIYCISIADKTLSIVASWDVKKINLEMRDIHLNRRFESYLYAGVLGGRVLKVSSFYVGKFLHFSMPNFENAVDKIIEIQSKKPCSDHFFPKDTIRVLTSNQSSFGLSDLDVKKIKQSVCGLSANREDLFKLRSQHGDCVPRNIVLNNKNKLSFIDSSDDVECGFFLTDISTLMVAFMAGEPEKTNPQLLKSRVMLSRFKKMQCYIIKRLGLTKEEVMIAFIIGLLEKIRLCEIEDRRDVINYWVRLTGSFIEHYISMEGVIGIGVRDDQ